MLPGTYMLWGAFMQTTEIHPTIAAFSIRRVAGQFEGTVSIDAEAQSGPPYLVHVAGPFQTPVP
jgi:hypothetical protein